MSTVEYRRGLLSSLAPKRIPDLGQHELMEVVAAIWGDVELAALLHGSENFIWERMRFYAERGYLTAQEDQGLRRTLALAYRRQLASMLEEPLDVEYGTED